jgi:hypothetical protein
MELLSLLPNKRATLYSWGTQDEESLVASFWGAFRDTFCDTPHVRFGSVEIEVREQKRISSIALVSLSFLTGKFSQLRGLATPI